MKPSSGKVKTSGNRLFTSKPDGQSCRGEAAASIESGSIEPPVLLIRNLNYDIDSTRILHDISFKACSGEFIGLIGPNGAGKTSLLKCINRINDSDGTIELKCKDIRRMNEKKIALEVALMHQDIHVNFPFPAFDIVLMGRYPYMKFMRSETKEDIRIAKESMQYTDTLHLEKKPVTQMSGGERQRVVFAKVITQSTGILLLDEPAANLDITHQEQIFRYSGQLCAKGKTVITAVHDLKIAARYCTRLILMKEGRIIADGAPAEVITAHNIYEAYGVSAVVYVNNISGYIDYHVTGSAAESACKSCRDAGTPPTAEKSDRLLPAVSVHGTLSSHNIQASPLIHIIGGGNSSSDIIRVLYEYGCRMTAGILPYGDADAVTADVFGVKYITSPPFTDINTGLCRENASMAANADLTILCGPHSSPWYAKNLEAARHARKLIIITDSGSLAIPLLKDLKDKALMVVSR
ncbi:MAG: ABC transporter ATP-binding protein, partial [Eubacteriales bacterium]|nr:ABC transporter ATP-binding protein [Eubacteriales bacterium]